MTKNEITGRLRDGGLDASSTNRNAAVYVTDARSGRSEAGWFAYRIICNSEETERRARAILSRWYDIEASGNVWRLRSRDRVPLMAIKRGGVPPVPTGTPMYFEAREPNSTVSMVSKLTTAPNLEYSTDGETWQEWQHTTSYDTHTFDTIILGAIGDRVYLRGDNPDGLGYVDEEEDIRKQSSFVLDGSVAAGGNIISLLDTTMQLTEVPHSGFYCLFQSFDNEEVTSLITPPDMSSITAIGDYGCYHMYDFCTSITDAANMPALVTIGVHGCDSMYAECDSLTAAADMSSLTTIGDYGCCYMNYSCDSLTAAADMPSLTTIGEDGCDSMYGGCTSLTAAADMPSLTTIGYSGCYSMYADDTSLTAAADMPSLTTIGEDGCDSMYSGCTFNMSDDGTTLNFAFPTPPITAGETTYSTAYDIADWMGNTNGF